MIFWVILMCWASGVQSNHSAEIISLQTFQLGDDVIIKCFLTRKGVGKSLVWYKQSTGEIPRAITISYYNHKGEVIFDDEFKDGRFSILSSKDSFHLNITAATKQDTGIYYCGTVFLNLIEFISGAHLMLQGAESKDVNMDYRKIPVMNGTTIKMADSNSQKVRDFMLLCLISSTFIVLIIITLTVDHCKYWRKSLKGPIEVTSLLNKIGNSHYTAVSFASVPPARRSNNKHLSRDQNMV
nr:novel immune-type receptor 6c, allele 3 [Danio rerio]